MLHLPVYRRGLVLPALSFGQAFGQTVMEARDTHALGLKGEGHRHPGELRWGQ